MRRGRKRIGGRVLAAAVADSAAADFAIAKAGPAVAGMRDNGGNPAGNHSRLNRPGGEPGRRATLGRILWLVDQAQRSRSGRRNWLARTSSAKKRPRGNSASSTRYCMGPTTEPTSPTRTIRSARRPTWIVSRSIKSPRQGNGFAGETAQSQDRAITGAAQNSGE